MSKLWDTFKESAIKEHRFKRLVDKIDEYIGECFFNIAKKQLVTNYKGQNKVIALPQPAYDDLSLEIQIREDLKAGKFRGNYYMADRNTVEAVPFKKSAMTRITVPAGTFDVVRIDRVHDDKDRQTSFWLAPKLDYLPVKVVQNNDGKKMEMNAELKTRLLELGWSEKAISGMVWGELMEGDVHGVTLRRQDGTVKYYGGPFHSVKKNGQLAIVRFA